MSNFIKSCFLATFILVLLLISNKTFALDLTSAIHIYTPIELKPISYSHGVKLANVCSVTDVECRQKSMMFDVADDYYEAQCRDEGYNKTASNCPTGQSPDQNAKCPYFSKLYKRCLCDTSVYTHTGTDTSVCGKYNVTVNTCSDDRGSHFSCECNSGTLCNGATQYVLPALKNDSSMYCLDDNGDKKYANEACLSCAYPTVLKADKTGCECPSAFSECTYGPEIGSEQCSINGETFYSNCKTCDNLGTYTACPTGYTCELETCSGKYYTTGCQSGYNYTCSGTGYSGGSGTACNSKYTACTCSSGYEWSGSACTVIPCPGYYACGGTWQYCTGTTCSADSSKCSVSCVSDYFPNKCDSQSACTAAGGVYRNGYCSKVCAVSCSSSYAYTCSGTGYSGGSGTACNSKYTACTCSSGYEWSGSACTAQTTETCDLWVSPWYWNGNGTKNIDGSLECFSGYGEYATIVIPSSGMTVKAANISFWNYATVTGGSLTVTDNLWLGAANGLAATHVTFDVPVTVNGDIGISNGSTIKFNKGISGNYTCSSWTTWENYQLNITCPF